MKPRRAAVDDLVQELSPRLLQDACRLKLKIMLLNYLDKYSVELLRRALGSKLNK